jgi:Glyoxalase-like domain
MISSAGTEVDHVFICTSAGAPEAERLIDFGLTEGSANRHPGQGSANRRFFFANAMLELLWIEDAVEAQSEPARELHLWERWFGREGGACPFGICLRPTQGESASAPFPAWEYRPAYSSTVLPVARNSAAFEEPLVFYSPVHRRTDTAPEGERQPYEHALPIRELTSVRISTMAAVDPSAAMQAAMRTGAFSYRFGRRNLLELGFDYEQQGRSVDLRPILPLVLLW